MTRDLVRTRWPRPRAEVAVRLIPHPLDVLSVAFMAVPPVAVLADKATVPLLLFAAIAAAPGALKRGWRPTIPTVASMVLAGCIVFWATASIAWTIAPTGAALTLASLLSLGLAGWALADILAFTRQIQPDARRRLIGSAATGIALGAMVLIGEILLDHPLVRIWKWDWTSAAVSDAKTNRGASLLVILFWIVLPQLRAARGAGLAAAILIASLALTFLFTDSASNQLGLLTAIGFCLYASAEKDYRLILWCLMVLVCLLAVPWLAQLPYDLGLHTADKLPVSVRHRFHIWNFAAEWALERPFVGWGFDSTSEFSNRGVTPFTGAGSVIPLHTHNAGLQIWLELGVVGIALAIALIAVIVRRIEARGPRASIWLGAALVATLVIAETGYGIWQTQWIATMTWLVCYARALWPAARR